MLMDMWENDVNSNPDQVFKDDDQKNLQKLFMNMMGWSQNDYDKINTTYISKKVFEFLSLVRILLNILLIGSLPEILDLQKSIFYF